MGMMGMMNNTGNVYQKMLNKYGYGGDFRNTPQAIQYSTEVLPVPQQAQEKAKIPATFWSQMAKYYFF